MSIRRRIARFSIFTLTVAIPCLLASCLPVPLGDPAKSKVDPALKGFWKLTSGDKDMFVAIAPFDEHAYIVQAVEFKMDGDKPDPKSSLVFKAWLTPVKGQTFMTLEFARQMAATAPDEERLYPTFKVEVKDDQLTGKLLDAEFFKEKNLKTSAQLEEIITANLDNAAMYTKEPATYQRLDPVKDKAFIDAVLK